MKRSPFNSILFLLVLICAEASASEAVSYTEQAPQLERVADCSLKTNSVEVQGNFLGYELSKTGAKAWAQINLHLRLPERWSAEGATVREIFLAATENRWKPEIFDSFSIVVLFNPKIDPLVEEPPSPRAEKYQLASKGIALKDGRYLVIVPELSFIKYPPVWNHEPGDVHFLVFNGEQAYCKQKMEIVDVE